VSSQRRAGNPGSILRDAEKALDAEQIYRTGCSRLAILTAGVGASACLLTREIHIEGDGPKQIRSGVKNVYRCEISEKVNILNCGSFVK
jgi:hypothetical protein